MSERLRQHAERVVDDAEWGGCDASVCPLYHHAEYDTGCTKGIRYSFYGEPDERKKEHAACVESVYTYLAEGFAPAPD